MGCRGANKEISFFFLLKLKIPDIRLTSFKHCTLRRDVKGTIRDAFFQVRNVRHHAPNLVTLAAVPIHATSL